MMKKGTKNPQILILFGPPGSGKGTQAELLSERLNLYYFETSKILEEKFSEGEIKKDAFAVIDGKNFYIQKEKELWQKGLLCSPPFVSYLVAEKIRQLQKEGKNLILSGSPRTLYEGKKIIPLLKRLYGQDNIRIILLEQDAEVSIFRNTHRRICSLMRHPILYSKETEKLKKCPLDGSDLIRREGLDDPETIKVRLKEYKERTFPLVEYFKKENLKIRKIDASPPPAEVFENILKVLDKSY